MSRSYLFIFFFLLFHSCKPIVGVVYGVNKEIKFNSIEDYKDYVSDKYKIDPINLYYIDKKHYNQFVKLIAEKKIDYFFGTFINDSIAVLKSDYLKQHQSCVERVLDEIKFSSIEMSQSSKVEDNTFRTYSFINIATHRPLQFSRDAKIKVVLIYSYKSGIINKNDFTQIQTLIDSTETHELIIISIDNIVDLMN